MRRLLWTVLFVIAVSAHAQLLPIYFDQTVTLPMETDIWDVMPHPDGYFLWVAATEPYTEQTRIYWGRMDQPGYDSLDLAVGAPLQLFAYWAEGHEASCILVSRLVWTYDSEEMDSTAIYRLSLALSTDSLLNRYIAYSGFGPWPGLDYWVLKDYHIATYLALPPPPAVSTSLFGEIGVYHAERYSDEYGSSSASFYAGMVCRDLLSDSYPWYDFHQQYGPGLWGDAVFLDSAVFVATTGNRFWEHWPPVPPTPHYTVGAGLRRVNVSSDSAIASWSSDGQVSAEPVVCTVDSTSATAILFTKEVGVCGAVGGDSISWTTSINYSHWLADDAVPNNGHEEFLCYDPTRQVFDILDPADGHSYGSSTVCSIMNEGAKIICRYDSTFRRLALRSGNQLQLYRFGEYLAAEDNSILPPSSFILSCYPNPFNSTTEIRFDLPRAGHVNLNIYDITGREVAKILDQEYTAGSHKVNFDAGKLSSGLYFARLSADGISQTQKMVLLK